MRVVPGYEYFLPGSRVCRGNFTQEFTILGKFSSASLARYSVTILNITSPSGLQFAMTLDFCRNQLVVQFPSSCRMAKLRLPFSPLSRASYWHKFSISVYRGLLIFFMDCDIQLVLPISRDCVVECSDASVVSLFQPEAKGTCGTPDQVCQPLPPPLSSGATCVIILQSARRSPFQSW